MGLPGETDADRSVRVRQQEVVAELGQRALDTDDLDGLMADVSVAVAEALHADYCAVFELLPGGDEAAVREGIGWYDDRTDPVPTGEDSQVGRALHRADPVVVADLRTDERFSDETLLDRGVRSGITARVGPTDDPWGALGVYATDPREFTERDAPFVGSVANVLAAAVDRDRTRSELERTERRFEAIFEDPNILVGLLDPDGTVLDVNQKAMEYVDADLERVTGEPFWETPWWGEGDDVRTDVREWVERAAAGEYVNFEADLARPDGERYTLEGVFRPVTNDDGEVVSVIVSDRDVTERKQREQALRQSEQRYRTLAETFPNGNVTLFDEELRYTLAAGQIFDELPVSREDVEGRTPREAWGEEVGEALEPVLRAALDGEERSVELSYVGREWVVHAVPITDERGNVFAGMTMAQDITERKWFERTLTALHESSRELLQLETEVAVCESVLRTTTDVLEIPGTTIYLYDGEKSELGPVAASEYVEDIFGDLPTFGPDDEAITWRAFAEGETITFDDVTETDLTYREDTPLRSGIWIPLGDHGVLAVVSEEVGAFDRAEEELADLLAATAETALDRVEREQQRRRHERELEEQNERLDRFASMLAHELRNPVTIGQIYSQQLPDEADDEAVGYVTEAFDRIEEMIDVMLVLTRGREAIGERIPVELPDVVREAWRDVDAPEATLEVEAGGTIRADETYVRHLFKNLFENAVVHGGEGITVTVGERPTGFYVADDGRGISPEDRDAVFEAGYTTASAEGGTGLGLAFVRELAEVYEWNVEVTESETGGARFEFTNVNEDGQ